MPEVMAKSSDQEADADAIIDQILKADAFRWKWIHRVGVLVAGALAGAFQTAAQLSSVYGLLLTCLSLAFLLVSLMSSLILASGENLLPMAALRAKKAEDDLKNLRAEQAEFEDEFLELGERTELIGLLHTTVSALYEYAESIIINGLGEGKKRSDKLLSLLDIALSHKNRLLNFGDERYSLSIYLPRGPDNNLNCVATVRSARIDQDRAHRIWPPGKGQVGRCFEMGEQIVLEDTQDPARKVMYDAPPDLKRAHDTEAYVSIASIPIRLSDGSVVGVVHATSNVKGRFFLRANGNSATDTYVGDDRFDTAELVRAIASTLAVILASEKRMKGSGSSSGKAMS